MSIIPRTDSATRRTPTVPCYMDTIRKLVRAVARLELAETETTEHVETAVRISEQSLQDRCYRIESLEFLEHVGAPKQAFRTTDEACARLVTNTFSIEEPPVSLPTLQDAAPWWA